MGARRLEAADVSAAAAFALADAGCAVLPLLPRSKRPALRHWPRGPVSARVLEAWFHEEQRGVGVLTGAPSHGLAVLDFDGDEAERWAAGAGLPTAPEVRTARGRHLWCRTPPGVRLTSGTALLGVHGLDLRAADAYAVAPDSVHPTGRPYEWLRTPWDLPPPLLPERLVGQLLRPSWHRDRVDVLALLDGVEEGRRNDSAARVCGHLLSRGLFGAALRVEMRVWNARNRPPLPVRELEAVTRSIERHEARKGAESRERLRPVLELAWQERPRFGRTAAADADVYAAHLRIAWRAGRLTWHASARDVAVEAWTTRWTATEATRRLVRARLLVREDAAEGARAAVYAVPPSLAQGAPAPFGCWESGWIWDDDDTGALAREEREALAVLRRLGRPVSFVALGLALGATKNTVLRVLASLEALGLAEHGPEGWRPAEGDREALAARRNARRAERERMAVQFAEERQAYRELLARRKEWDS